MSVGARPELLLDVTSRRKIKHMATCNTCEQRIYDVRYNCTECENWDCCSNCAALAEVVHPGHVLKPYLCPKWDGFDHMYQIFPFAGKIKKQHNRNDLHLAPGTHESPRSWAPPDGPNSLPNISSPQSLCLRCSQLFSEDSLIDGPDNRDEAERKVLVHPVTGLVYIAARDGCALCAMLWHKFGMLLGLPDPIFALVKKDSLHFFIKFDDGIVNLLTLGLFWHENPSEQKMVADEKNRKFLEPLRNDKGRYSFLNSSNSGSPAVLELAKAWYNDCSEHHPSCKALTEFEGSRAQWNPTRLLDIGASPNGDDLHLVECRAWTEPIEYTALSHCWGKNQHLRLLQSNRKDLMTHVDSNTLSSSFMEAIEATRCLGMRYIWIDSICIIQDSKEDWEIESALMGQVYRHCECCIAATAAPDGAYGCFADRDTRVLGPLIFPRASPFSLENMRTSPGEQQKGPGYYEILDLDLWVDEVELGILTTRGWAFQERALSHRILHFGKTQIFWECRQRTACESYPVEMPRNMAVPWREELVPRTRPTGHGPAYLAQDTEQTPRQHAYKFWKNSLQQYSSRLLTVEGDKLPALSGIAKHVQQAAKDEYFAGLWGGNMVRDLLWRLEDRRAPPAEWTAPTWSWASRNCYLNIFGNYSFKAWSDMPDEPDLEELIKLLHVSVTPSSQDPTGQVSEGHVILYGQLAPAFIKSKKCEVDPDGAVIWSESSLHVLVDGGKLEEISDVHNCFPDEPVEDEEVLVYCLPVIDFGGTRQFFITGLLLKPVDEVEFPGVFFRYGIFQAGREEKIDRLFAGAAWWETQTENFGQPYIEENDVRRFLVYLV